MRQQTIPRATLGRLPTYLQYLKSQSEKIEYISSTAIAKALSLGDVQVRKDLSAVCNNGRPKIGFCVSQLISCLEQTLGGNSHSHAVLIGAGKLGEALLGYDEFEDYGIKIIAAFDNNSDKLNKVSAGKPVLPISSLAEFCRENSVKIGIIAVPASAAQSVCDSLCNAGVSAIWNFAPVHLTAADSIILRHENLALSLAHLNMQINNSIQEEHYEKENL